MHKITSKRDFFNGIAPRWIKDTDIRRARLERIFRLYDIPAVAPVLDIGSGTGILLPFLRENNSGSELIVELEISGEMLDLARTAHGDMPGTGYVQGDAHRLPFPDSSFATAMCFSVYPHFHAPATAIGEIRRCLLPGGRLCILHLMGHHELNAMHREAGEIVSRDFIPPAENLAMQLHVQGFEPYQVVEQSDLYLLLATRT